MSVRIINAWPEGSTLPARYPIDDGATYRAELRSLSVAVTGFEAEFPVLARAAHRTVPAGDLLIGWSLPNGSVRENHMTITRTPWTIPVGEPSDSGKDKWLFQHMGDIEKLVASDRAPYQDPAGRFRMMGGAKYFLGREPDERDTLILQPLAGRELVFRTWLNAGGYRTSEWMSELTIEARPGP